MGEGEGGGEGLEARGDSNRNAQCVMLNVQLNIENCALNIPWKYEIRLSPLASRPNSGVRSYMQFDAASAAQTGFREADTNPCNE